MAFFSEEPSIEQVPLLSPQQQRLQNANIKEANRLRQGGYQKATSLLEQYLDPNSEIYRNFETPYIREFEDQIIPQLAERFAGGNAMGGGLMTSGFGQSLSAAGANLQAQLAQMKDQFRHQSISDLINQYNNLSNRSLNTREFENQYNPGSEGWGVPLLKAGAIAAGTVAGGPIGGAIAGGLTSLFPNNAQNQSQPFRAGSSGNSGYQGRFGQLPNYGGY